MLGRKYKEPGLWFLLTVTIVLVCQLLSVNPIQGSDRRPTNYSISVAAPFNQPDYYDPLAPVNAKWYRSNGEWIGRLILPSPQEIAAYPSTSDWVWVELYHTPEAHSQLRGKKLPLTWSDSFPQTYINLVTTDLELSPAARESDRQGNVIPQRLDQRQNIGPLQSLAGARPLDDVVVRLLQVEVSSNNSQIPRLTINYPPLQITGVYSALVQIEAPADQGTPPAACPGPKPCETSYFQVRHYQPSTGKFTGDTEVIYIPQQPPTRDDRFKSTPQQLAEFPAGEAGWYIYGAKNQQGIFTVQALKPRSLFQLDPDISIGDSAKGIQYIHQGNWQDTPRRKGKISRVLVQPTPTTPEIWQEGDIGLLIHSFGGIGGEAGEKQLLGTVTGHFSYGIGKVIRDPFTQELQLEAQYVQVYAQNPEGIISGTISWENYMGNLQRGWLGTRPVSDVVIKLDAITQDYNFDGRIISPLAELVTQLQIMAARYRTGDGTGNSAVTPSTSCVQDSNQALYIAIENLRRRVSNTPEIMTWLQSHPDHPQTQRWQKLLDLGKDLEAFLIPQGIVREDWQQNVQVEYIAGSRKQQTFISDQSLNSALLSWYSILPRTAYDRLSHIFLKQGATLWFLRTNQVGGYDPTILPLAPTPLLGEVPVLSLLGRRILASLIPISSNQVIWITLATLLLYGAIAIPWGWVLGFLRWQFSGDYSWSDGKKVFTLLLMPAFTEELCFRVLLLPHPAENASLISLIFWSTLSLFLFIIYHPLNARFFYKAGDPTFFQADFLSLSALLGLACTLVYLSTGSIYGIVFIHWLVVVIWLYLFQGNSKLNKGIN